MPLFDTATLTLPPILARGHVPVAAPVTAFMHDRQNAGCREL